MNDPSSTPRDDVPRLAAYREAHPDTDISPPGPGQTMWIARSGGVIVAADVWLGKLLDTLDWLEGDDDRPVM